MCCQENSTLNPLQNAFNCPLWYFFGRLFSFCIMCLLLFSHRQRTTLVKGAWTLWASRAVYDSDFHDMLQSVWACDYGAWLNLGRVKSYDLFMRNLLTHYKNFLNINWGHFASLKTQSYLYTHVHSSISHSSQKMKTAQFEFVSSLLMNQFRLCIFGRNILEVILCSHCILSLDTWFQYSHY